MCIELNIVRKINDNIFEVDEEVKIGFYYTINKEKISCARIIKGKQFVAIGDIDNLLNKGETTRVLNWIR